MTFTITQLRSKLRLIRKEMIKGLGYEDFKYLHKKNRNELEALYEKYKKYDKDVKNISATTIQQAIKAKLARKKAERLIETRDLKQASRDLTKRLSLATQNAAILNARLPTNNLGYVAKNMRSKYNVNQNFEMPLIPFSTFDLFQPINKQRPLTAPNILPPLNYRSRLQNPTSSSIAKTNKPLGRIQVKPRPSSADRTFLKNKPL